MAELVFENNLIFTSIDRLPNCPQKVNPTSPGESCCFNYLDQWSIFETYDDHTWPYLRRTLIMLCCADSTLRLVGGLGNATKEVSTKLLNVQNHISSFFGQNTHKEERKHLKKKKQMSIKMKTWKPRWVVSTLSFHEWLHHPWKNEVVDYHGLTGIPSQ